MSLRLSEGFKPCVKRVASRNFRCFFLANQLYQPSYVSLESALSYYGIIPEGVYAITSISSKKTQQFNNPLGHFMYHHIDPELFGDFVMQKDEFNNPVYIASKERAIIDFLYLRVDWARSYDEDIFISSYRFQNLEDIDIKKLETIAKSFKQKKMQVLLSVLIKTIRNEDD